MSSSTYKFIRIIAIASVVSVGIWYALKTPKITQQAAPASESISTVDTHTRTELSVQEQLPNPSTSSPDFSKIDSSKPISIDGKPYMLFSPAEIEGLQDWMSDRGYFNEQDKEAYSGYSDAVLQELGKKGDLLALHLLTDRAVKNADSRSASHYMTLGAIYGSTADLDGLTIYTAPNSTNDATEEQRRPSALETLAVTKLIAIRGDRSLSAASERGFINSYKNLYGVDLKLTSEEEKFVADRAQEMYDTLVKIRTAQGLGDFDNGETSGVKKFFGLQ